jgi:MraZ protein
MFRGHAEAKIDAKGRLKVPSVFLRPLQERFGPDIFTTSLHGDCAWIYPLRLWELEEQRMARLPATHRLRRKWESRVSYFGLQSRLDSQGRLMVPAKLRGRAGIEGEVVIFGRPDRLEVWNLERMENDLDSEPFTDGELDELTDDLEALDASGNRDVD